MTKTQRYYQKKVLENPLFYRDQYAKRMLDPLYIEKRKVLCRNWYTTHRRKRRKALIEDVGGKCVQCGFLDWRALQIDHVNGGGSQERRSRIIKDWSIKSAFDQLSLGIQSGKYQILCANCNWIKRYEKEELKRCQ